MKKTARSAKPGQHRHQDHLFKIGVLDARSRDKRLSRATRKEALQELDRYWDEGLTIQKFKESNMGMTKSGHCAFESPGSHSRCNGKSCDCECHDEPRQFSGRGILFAVIDDREEMRPGKITTVEVITEAIEAALDAGKETSEDIARYLTTSAFQHIQDKRVRFNSVLKAGDIVGAHLVRKLYNSYDELMDTADKSKSPKDKEALTNEARGFAEAIQIILSPFSVEDAEDVTLVNWDEVDHLTETFEKDRKVIRAERKRNR